MPAFAIDRLSIAKRLGAAGFTADQAETVAAIVSEATDPETRSLVTNKDLDIKLAPIHSELKLLRWMTGMNTALIVAVLVKLFIG